MEADPGMNSWAAIQSKMGITQSATATTAATKGFTLLKLAKIGGLITGAVATGLGIGYIAFNGENNPSKPIEDTTTNTLVTEEKEADQVGFSEGVAVTEINSITKQDKVVSIIEVKKGEETKKLVVEVSTADLNKGNSVVGGWLTGNNNPTSKEIIKEIMRQLENENDETVASTDAVTNITGDITVQSIEENTVIPGIKASVTSGNAPLTVEFSNITDADHYEWKFDDKTSSREANPSHTFIEPGNYVVQLIVQDSKGKSYSDKLFIEVKEKETNSAREESAVEKFNVFSPNGDGMNETFLRLKNISQFEITIADSKGNIVYTGTDPDRQWNGQDRSGNLCPEGNYTIVYRATGSDKKQYKDRFTLRLER